MPWTCEVWGFLLHGFRMEEGGSDGRVLEALEESHLECVKSQRFLEDKKAPKI